MIRKAYETAAEMRIEQLEYLAAVTRLGSFRRAAEELHVSQPALSETIRNLERELGVSVLDRGRYGARISDEGHEILPHIIDVLDAVDRLRSAADQQHLATRMVRIGTVNAATVPLLAPAIQEFRDTHPMTQVEVTTAQQAQIHMGIQDGSLDLGLVNYLEGDDYPPELHTRELLRGRPVVCMRTDNPLAEKEAIKVTDLLSQPLIVMRTGYVMHRYLHRVLAGRMPPVSYSTDGADMGKLFVAEGLGVTVLPDFSVTGDPLEREGFLVGRPLYQENTCVLMVVQQRRAGFPTRAARDLHQILVNRARAYPPHGKGDPA